MARDRLRDLIGGADDTRLVGEAGDGLAAVRYIDALRPDLVFLDVRLPGITGLQVLEPLALLSFIASLVARRAGGTPWRAVLLLVLIIVQPILAFAARASAPALSAVHPVVGLVIAVVAWQIDRTLRGVEAGPVVRHQTSAGPGYMGGVTCARSTVRANQVPGTAWPNTRSLSRFAHRVSRR